MANRLSFLLPRVLVIASVMALAHVFVGYQYWSENILPANIKLPFGLYLVCSVAFILTAFLGRFLIKSQWLRESLNWAGMMAMGIFSSLFVFTLLRLLILVVLGSLIPDAAFSAWQVVSAYVVFAVIFVVVVWGYLNARLLPVVETVPINLKRLPRTFDGLRIVQLSDIHIGPTIKGNYLTAVVDKVNALKPDLIVITGDLVDGSVNELKQDVSPLGRLSAPMGVFFVTGNHEYYSGAIEWVDYLRSLSIDVLLNEHRILSIGDDQIALAGVTDYSAGNIIPEHQSKPALTLQNIDAQIPVKILLAHQPRSAIAAEKAGADLQLSGHTHGGQFWPWNYFVRLQQPYNIGLHQHGKLQLYINRGTGYWGPPKRLFKRAEISLIELKVQT